MNNTYCIHLYILYFVCLCTNILLFFQEAQRAAKAKEAGSKGTPAAGDTKDDKPKEVAEPAKEQAKKKQTGIEKYATRYKM